MFGRWKSRTALARAEGQELFSRLEASIRETIAQKDTPFSIEHFGFLNRTAGEDYEAGVERCKEVPLADLLPYASDWQKSNDPHLRIAAAGVEADTQEEFEQAIALLMALMYDADPRVVVAAIEATASQPVATAQSWKPSMTRTSITQPLSRNVIAVWYSGER